MHAYSHLSTWKKYVRHLDVDMILSIPYVPDYPSNLWDLLQNAISKFYEGCYIYLGVYFNGYVKYDFISLQ